MDHNRLLRLPEVQERVSLGRSTIWLWIKEGRFPNGKKLSSRVTVWLESDIEAFVRGVWSNE